ncbi:MAG: 50S ribosomal protein L11 methyltransferase [Woeseiaceae bacterium]|nr:50S ribosomal protein L11 methyltransferase [Woeseiaceae bacterium]
MHESREPAAGTRMDWRQFVMDLDALPADAVEALFARHGAEAITLSDAGDDPVLEPGPGEAPLWNQTRITGLFTPAADFDALAADLRRTFGLAELPAHRIDELADRAWEREWLRDFRPMRFGSHLWVCPRGQRPDDAAAVVIEMDPGLAFGTGTHPTTAMCLEWLDEGHARGILHDARVLDFGCGSGILAIAALRLGAAHATGVDIDDQALTASRRNAADNAVAARFDTSAAPAAGVFDIALANILAAPLVDRAAWLCERLADDARLVLSGILDHQVDAVRAAYRPWIEFEPAMLTDGWARLAGRKR